MDLQYILELLGTFVFAISGALAVRDKEHDIFGAGFTGFVTAIGGGSLRDLLLDAHPLVWIKDILFLYAILLGILAAFAFPGFLSRLRKTMFLFDTLGLGFFTILGVEKSLALGVRPEIAAIMGMFSGVMGGVLRDTLVNEIPILFRKEIYATAGLAGAILYLVMDYFGLSRDFSLLVSISVIILIRLVAVKYKLSLPKLN